MDLTVEQRKAHIQALLREREGYVRYGRTEDAAAVDEQLKVYGHAAQPPAKRATRMTRPKAGAEL